MNQDTTWILSYSENKLKDIKDKILDDIKTINKAMKKVYSNNCIIVTITPSSLDGTIEHHTDIHIFDNFLDANPLLNQEQKEDDNVTVMQYNLTHDKFLFLMLKEHDHKNYKRISKRRSEAMFNEFGLEGRVMFLYNSEETKVTIHRPT